MLSKRQKAILVGTLLGDGHLEQNGKNVRLRVGHGLPQREYIAWKYRELKDLVRGNIRTAKIFHSKRNKYYKHLQFSTLTCSDFTEWRNIFYCQGKKIVPKNISDLLNTPLSLAVWHMDDGYKRNDCNALRLNTDTFSINDQKLLINCLKNNFGIKSKLHKKDRTYNIYIGSKFAKIFCDLVKPHIIDSLLYKVSLTP